MKKPTDAQVEAAIRREVGIQGDLLSPKERMRRVLEAAAQAAPAPDADVRLAMRNVREEMDRSEPDIAKEQAVDARPPLTVELSQSQAEYLLQLLDRRKPPERNWTAHFGAIEKLTKALNRAELEQSRDPYFRH